jgi:hypothetical protein
MLSENIDKANRERPMSSGLEYQHMIVEALNAFEDAVVHREKKLIGSKVPLQQDVDTARDKLMKVIVDIVMKERGSK